MQDPVLHIEVININASVNSSCAHTPRAIVEHFPTLSVPGVGH